jgi:hypothetical protein
MGGFMTFWISGKYPDLFTAAGNFLRLPLNLKSAPKISPLNTGHIDMHKNYGAVKLRLNYGDQRFYQKLS